MKPYRVVALASLLACATLLSSGGSAQAQSEEELCSAIGCPDGPRKCGEIYGSIRDERCEEGVMCCPFPEELFYIPCGESTI